MRALIAAMMMLVSCDSPQPSAGNQYTYRVRATGHVKQDDSKYRYYDTKEGVWYDINHHKWSYNENGWHRL
jgi:hypothetical protein